MDVIGVILINLFFVPFISVAISAGRQGKKISCSMAFWVSYGCYATLIVPFSKILASLVEKALSMPVELYSGYYTLCAIPVAALLPFVSAVLKKMFHLTCEIKKNEEK